MKSWENLEADEFQSTLSVRRATGFKFDKFESKIISIHALREESDVCSFANR